MLHIYEERNGSKVSGRREFSNEEIPQDIKNLMNKKNK